MTEKQIRTEIENQVNQCDKLGLPRICSRISGGKAGLDYVVNRVISLVTTEGQTISSSLVHIETELDEVV